MSQEIVLATKLGGGMSSLGRYIVDAVLLEHRNLARDTPYVAARAASSRPRKTGCGVPGADRSCGWYNVPTKNG